MSRDEAHAELPRTPPASSAWTRATRSARCPDKSQLTLHLEAITNAVRDAGLKVSDVDGIFTAGQHSPALLGEALGIDAALRRRHHASAAARSS